MNEPRRKNLGRMTRHDSLGTLVPRLGQHRGQRGRGVVDVLQRQIDVPPGRLGALVQVAMEGDRAGRYLA